MVRLLAQYLAVLSNENLPKFKKYFPKQEHSFAKRLKSYSRNGQRLFKFCLCVKIFAKSSHTARILGLPIYFICHFSESKSIDFRWELYFSSKPNLSQPHLQFSHTHLVSFQTTSTYASRKTSSRCPVTWNSASPVSRIQIQHHTWLSPWRWSVKTCSSPMIPRSLSGSQLTIMDTGRVFLRVMMAPRLLSCVAMRYFFPTLKRCFIWIQFGSFLDQFCLNGNRMWLWFEKIPMLLNTAIGTENTNKIITK